MDFQLRQRYPEVRQQDYDYVLKYDYGLYLIGLELAQADKELTSEGIKLPMHRRAWTAPGTNRLIAEETHYNVDQIATEASTSYDKFNDAQREAFDTIIYTIDSDPARAHFFL